MNPEENLDNIDEIKSIMHILRHDCDHLTKAEDAIKLIVEKTGMNQDRVAVLIKRMFK